jgi:hypothetical protein
MLAVRASRNSPAMFAAFPLPSDDLHARARQLAHAAEIVRTAAGALPGPESRHGFAGPVRMVYDSEARRVQGLLVDAETALVRANRHLHHLADLAGSAEGR